MEELGELSNVGLAEFPLTVKNQGGDGACAENGGQVRRPQAALLHEELDYAGGIDRRKRIGAIVVFFGEDGEQGVKRDFFRAGGAVLDPSTQELHHFDEEIHFRVGFGALGHSQGQQVSVLGGAERHFFHSFPSYSLL